MTVDETASRIDALEMNVAEHQKIIDELNEIITKQWDALDLMKRQLSRFDDQLEELALGSSAPTDQKPPHF